MLAVQHEAVPGYMPAMTMEFAVSPGDLANARPGQRIRAELIPDATGAPHLEKIWPDDKVAGDIVAAGTRALREDTSNRGKGAYREIGEAIPDFALYNQKGEVVTAARFRGRQIMVDFIYTRCPVATVPARDSQDDGNPAARPHRRCAGHRVCLLHARPGPRYARRAPGIRPPTRNRHDQFFISHRS